MSVGTTVKYEFGRRTIQRASPPPHVCRAYGLYWINARQWAIANVRIFAWWKFVFLLALALVLYWMIGDGVMGDIEITLPALVGSYLMCSAFECAWLLLFRAPAVLLAQHDAETEQLRARVSDLERCMDESRPRLTLTLLPHIGFASERWIGICNLGRRTAFDARIRVRPAGDCRIDFLPIALVRGGDRFDITDRVRVSRKSRGAWYAELRPAGGLHEILTGKSGMFEEVKTDIEILYMDNGVPMASRIELSAQKQYDGMAVQVTGQHFFNPAEV